MEISNEIFWSLTHGFAYNISTIAYEIIGRRARFQICCPIADHDNCQFIVRYQLTAIEISYLRYRFSFSAAAWRRLIYIKSTVISIEVKQELICEEICERNVKLLSNLRIFLEMNLNKFFYWIFMLHLRDQWVSGIHRKWDKFFCFRLLDSE